MHAHIAAASLLHPGWQHVLRLILLPRLTQRCCISHPPPCSLNVDTAATVGDARIQRIIDALPQECEEAGRTCKK